MKSTVFRRTLSCSALAMAGLILSPVAVAKDVVIHAGRLIDGVSGKVGSQMSILITDERITGVQKGFVTPAGAEVIDLSKATVLPGLIDAHIHMGYGIIGEASTAPMLKFTRTPGDMAFQMASNADMMLNLGFTTVRDVSSPTETIVALKNAIKKGLVKGPRMYVAGVALGPTGGHSDGRNGVNPDLHNHRWTEAVADGPEEMARAVRRLHQQGADLVKIFPSGGVLSPNDNPDHTLMTDAEIGAVVTTAHALGMKVAAHAHGTGAMKNAVRLGVDSIEHGTFSDADIFKMMKQKGTYLVPTLLVANRGLKIANERPHMLDPTSVAKAKIVAPGTVKKTGEAYKAGVKIAFGSDQTGRNAEEFALLVQAGMTPMDAIEAATRNAADLIGASGDIGTIQAGRYADIIAVSKDPLGDIRALEDVGFVMKGGAVVKPMK